jgi:hypothetical protein
MFELIEGLPSDVLAIVPIGTVTHEHYRNILVAKAEAMMANGPIKMIYVVGEHFTKFELNRHEMMARSELNIGGSSAKLPW